MKDLPRPSAHQVLVYRANGEFFVDKGEMRASDSVVVAATHVSLVDISLHAPVVVEIVVPAADATTFTIQVTYECTVTDPILVVQHGRADARSFLEGHLRANQRISELAHGHTFAEINTVRRKLNAWLLDDAVHNPPVEPGIEIRVSSVEVLMPSELTFFERRRREIWQSTILAAERASLVYSLTSTLEAHGLERRELRQQRERKLEAGLRGSHLDEVEKHLEKLGAGPQSALYLAYISGELTSEELATRLRDDADRDETRRREAAKHAVTEYVSVLKEWFSRGGADYVNVDPDKLDGLINRLIDDTTAAIHVLPFDEQLEEIQAGLSDDGDEAD
ncbi:hypothetical protein [Nocardia sp. NPDC050175]|uniref:hypothetical protein n=1 Tax=Nocardia sp. NPDC050175 TaxID=3364317 RepID=UPI00379FC619